MTRASRKTIAPNDGCSDAFARASKEDSEDIETVKVAGRSFDYQSSRDKLWAKFEAAVRKNEDKEAATSTWYKELYALEGLASVVQWCDEQGVEVLFSHREETCFYPQGAVEGLEGYDVIVVNSNNKSTEVQLFYILHECGHYLIGRNGSKHGGAVVYSECAPRRLPLDVKVKIVEEELEAWWRGMKLAGRLKLTVDSDRYEKVKAQCLISYMKWFL